MYSQGCQTKCQADTDYRQGCWYNQCHHNCPKHMILQSNMNNTHTLD